MFHLYSKQVALAKTGSSPDSSSQNFLQSQLASSLSTFMAQYQAKQAKLAQLISDRTELRTKNVELKKKWVKKHSDLVSVV